jgi:hypothetical protein
LHSIQSVGRTQISNYENNFSRLQTVDPLFECFSLCVVNSKGSPFKVIDMFYYRTNLKCLTNLSDAQVSNFCNKPRATQVWLKVIYYGMQSSHIYRFSVKVRDFCVFAFLRIFCASDMCVRQRHSSCIFSLYFLSNLKIYFFFDV